MLKSFSQHFNRLFFVLIVFIFFIFGIGVGQNFSFLGQRYGYGFAGQSDTECVLNLSGSKTVPDFVDKDGVDFALFWDVWKELRDQYYRRDEIVDSNLFYGAVRGMVASLGDPYTVFFDPDETEEFNKELQGTFEGIGAEIGIKHDRLTVIAPLSGSPAERAGLEAGDNILAIDGVDTYHMLIDEAVRRIRGEKGTEVVLTILSVGDDAPRDVSIIRDKIVVNTVSWRPVKGHKQLIYLRIFSFTGDTAYDFKQAVDEILKLNPKGLILDLRSNPGGYLDAAVSIASFWIEKGRVVVQEKFADGKVQVYNAAGKARLKDIKTIVLVNQGSASASEIVAGALRDYNKAIVVGEATFGKGVVQDYSTLRHGSSLKITVAEWLTPNGAFINQEGIKPDVEIQMTKEDFNNDYDPQLDQAVKLLE